MTGQHIINLGIFTVQTFRYFANQLLIYFGYLLIHLFKAAEKKTIKETY